jgi:ParB-like chromosome segregation protein Spo0J
MENEYPHIEIDRIGERFAGLRIVDPKADAAMEKSMKTYGQMTPVVAGRFEGDGYEMIDGFKRLRAAVRLEVPRLEARVFAGNVRAAKAAMILLNSRAKTISELEKGFVIRSLHRGEGLDQTRIAALLGRHKSWVCRILSVVERLSDEVTEHLKLGLVNMTVGRELARLPRGNQPEALRAVIEYNLTSDETARLVRLLAGEPAWAARRILGSPREALERTRPCAPPASRSAKIMERLFKTEIWLATTPLSVLGELPPSDKKRALSAARRIESALARLRESLEAKEGADG